MLRGLCESRCVAEPTQITNGHRQQPSRTGKPFERELSVRVRGHLRPREVTRQEIEECQRLRNRRSRYWFSAITVPVRLRGLSRRFEQRPETLGVFPIDRDRGSVMVDEPSNLARYCRLLANG